MRILLAPDKFKGTFTSSQVCDLLRRGIASVDPSIDVETHPLADGGEGTLDVLLAALGGDRIETDSLGPLGDPVTAPVGRLRDGTVIVESALFCGLALVPPHRRNLMESSTYGLGRVLKEVLSWNPPRLLVGIGGSATVDGGLGVAQAFGFALRDRDGRDVAGSAAGLLRLHSIEAPRRKAGVQGCSAEALCDVSNVLTGPEGAAAVFAPQKGATPEDAALLDTGLARLAEILRRDLGVQVCDLPGSGAAGGLGAGLRAFIGLRLRRGADVVLTETRFEDRLAGTDRVITGEGAYDAGSRHGKVVKAVIEAASRRGVPVTVVCGRCTESIQSPGVEILELGDRAGEKELIDLGKRLAVHRV